MVEEMLIFVFNTPHVAHVELLGFSATFADDYGSSLKYKSWLELNTQQKTPQSQILEVEFISRGMALGSVTYKSYKDLSSIEGGQCYYQIPVTSGHDFASSRDTLISCAGPGVLTMTCCMSPATNVRTTSPTNHGNHGAKMLSMALWGGSMEITP